MQIDILGAWWLNEPSAFNSSVFFSS
uniref:Uncharacterized protein n=1 Tax=Arundo donax TaxID=35708 RepID=A0A0A9EK48_ARUDO